MARPGGAVPADGEHRSTARCCTRSRSARSCCRRASRRRRARSCPRSSTNTTSWCSPTRGSTIISRAGRRRGRTVRGGRPEDCGRARGCCASARSSSCSGSSRRSGIPRAKQRRARGDRPTNARRCTRRSIVTAGTAMGAAARRRRLLHVLRRVRAEAQRTSRRGCSGSCSSRARLGDGHRQPARAVAAQEGPRGVDSRGRARRCRALPLVFAARSYGRAVARRRRARGRGGGRVRARRVRQPAPARRCGRRAWRAFARFETRFQLVWVVGGLLAVVFPGGGRAGIFLVALVLLFAGLSYVGTVRRRPVRRPRAGENRVVRGEPPELERADASRSARSTTTSCRRCSRPTSGASSAPPRDEERADSWVRGRARPHARRVRRRDDGRLQPRVHRSS